MTIQFFSHWFLREREYVIRSSKSIVYRLGIVVACQQTRFLEKNRLLARRQLQEKLDIHYNGEQGLVAQYKREKSEKRDAKRLETKKTLEKKRAFKAEEDIHLNIKNDKSPDKPIE